MKLFKWIKSAARWVTGGSNPKPIPDATVKAAADAVVSQSRADIGVLATRLTSGELTVAELEPLMQAAIKRGIVANAALAHGGYDNLTPKILERLEPQVLAQHDYLRNRVEAIASNVRVSGELKGRDANDLLSYANRFRSVYENERVHSKRVIGHTIAWRILAAVKHCGSCAEVAARGKMPIDEMPEIGTDDCGDHCMCVTATE